MVRSGFQFHKVHGDLRPHVLAIFSIAVPSGGLEPQLVMPDGGACLMFNFGGPLSLIGLESGAQPQALDARVIARGARSRPYFLNGSQGIHVWGIKFRPDIWAGVFGFSQPREAYFWDSKIDGLFEGLWETCRCAETPERILGALRLGLTELIPVLFPPSNPVFLGVLEEVRYSMGSTKIDAILQDFGLPYKSVERYFRRFLAMTPKEYSQLLRITAAAMDVVENRTVPSRRLRSLGFSDRPHFFREFRRYFSGPPGRLLNRVSPNSFSYAQKVTRRELALMR